VIELVLADRCTDCGACVRVCPTDVFDPGADRPVIARQADCQTCFLCELYCEADALYVAPDCEGPTPGLDPAALLAAGLVGQYRRDSGWGEWAVRYANEHWRMEEIFARGRGVAK
jgi:NAD-dependent dihydropyrimidine dehydrogenase PreA subunit